MRNRQTDRQTETKKQRERERERETDRQTDRQTEKETEEKFHLVFVVQDKGLVFFSSNPVKTSSQELHIQYMSVQSTYIQDIYHSKL